MRGLRSAFLRAGCGGRVRRFHAVGSREAGAWGVLGNAAIKLVWRLCGRFDNCSSGGRGSEFRGNRPNRQITAEGASNNADMSRSWVGTAWPITEESIYRRQGCLWVPPGRDRGRAGCSCERVPANKSRGDWAQGVKRVDGPAILNCCGDRRGRVGWAAMGAGDEM